MSLIDLKQIVGLHHELFNLLFGLQICSIINRRLLSRFIQSYGTRCHKLRLSRKKYTVSNKEQSRQSIQSTWGEIFGKLHLDLISCTTGLPPGTKVQIELDRASDDFVLMKAATDTEDYQLELHCNLFVPIAQLSTALFSEIGSTFAHRSISLHFRRVEVRQISLPREKEEYCSDILFTDDMPCRIVVCFIPSKNKTGEQTSNPFDFQRSWPIPPKEEETDNTSRERQLEQKLNSMQEKLQRFESFLDLDDEMLRQIEEFQSSKKSTSGRGKRSQSFQGPSTFFGRLRTFVSSNFKTNIKYKLLI